MILIDSVHKKDKNYYKNLEEVLEERKYITKDIKMKR